jgi:ATP-dependent helicase/nuclease subunit A
VAAARAFPALRARATLQFLRGDGRAVDVTPTREEAGRFAREAPALALAAAAVEERDADPSTLGRDEARCRAEGCGYTYRCFPAPPRERHAIQARRAS